MWSDRHWWKAKRGIEEMADLREQYVTGSLTIKKITPSIKTEIEGDHD